MVVTLLAASTGAIFESRLVGLRSPVESGLQLLTAGVVATAFSAAVVAGALPPRARSSSRIFEISVAAIMVAIVSAFVENIAVSLLVGVVCAAPFAIAARWYPRRSAMDDATYAALTGAVLSFEPAMIVLFLATLTAIARARVERRPARDVRFFPYVAAFASVGLFVDFALLP